MPHFFENVTGDVVKVEGENANHIINALRMKQGEKLTLCDEGIDYNCEITEIGKDYAECKVLTKHKNICEPDVKVTIFQCIPKGDKLELVIQKAVELGVHNITPVLSERCVSRPDEKKAAKKVARYNKIAKSACEQSGRGALVKVNPVITFAELVKQLNNYECKILFYEGGGTPLKQVVKKTENICMIIGPEGGFSEKEVKLLTDNGATTTTLGKRILRTETAPIAGLTAIMLLTDNLE